jgi:predicted transcriptional regulator
METVPTSVRISCDAIETLSKLASKLGQSEAQVLESALQEMDERIFWSEVQEAFSREAGDADGLVERSVWEQASEADFQDEKW